MKPEVELSVGISVTSSCYTCQLLQDLCVDCEDSRQAKDADIAHSIVDEGNLQYPIVWYSVTEPSAHEWISPLVRQQDGSIRHEFKEPTTALIDRLFDLEESITLAKYESICQDCHMVVNRNAICPNCN